MNLFENEKIILPLQDGIFEYYPDFISLDKANEYFMKLLEETPWQHDTITVFGKTFSQPRLTALYGNNGKTYSYSSIIMHPHHFTPLLMFLKEKVESICQHHFTTILLNYYRDEDDSNGWHSDNERELGQNPTIASLSFGETRNFKLKHNTKPEQFSLPLENGSLFLMKSGSQIHYKHQLPKSSKPKKGRINLTFRTIL